MATLIIKTGRNAGTEFKLNAARMLIGRRFACQIPLADRKASREHALIFRQGESFFLQDLSRNGTLLNGVPAAREDAGVELKFNDEICIGDTVMQVIDERSELRELEIPGYELIEKVGSGGMGAVYKARQVSMDRVVALKVLNTRYSGNAEFVERFIREARAAGKLNHPNVIHVHDISRAGERHYFSMEFVDGASLKEILRQETRLDVRKALDLVLQAARALEFAHEHGIVHRDIKPDNIMVTGEGIVKLADLGIAKMFEAVPGAAPESRRVMGTPHYMAPEQALGKEIDHRADIYALGATFYHMLTGANPFSGHTAHQILKAHIQESLPPIHSLNPAVPDPVCFIIERMMAKIPDKRYPDMARVIQDLERAQRQVAESAAGGTGPDEARVEFQTGPNELTTSRQAIPRWGWWLFALALCVPILVAIVLLVRYLRQETPPPEKESAPTPVRETRQPEGGAVASNEQARRLLATAREAQANHDSALYEQRLNEIREKFAAAPEAEEAARLLDKLRQETEGEARRQAEALLAEAKNFEKEHAADGEIEACLEKYRALLGAVKLPAVREEALTHQKALEQRAAQVRVAGAAAALAATTQAAGAQQEQGDYDAARATWQAFGAAHGADAQGKEAQEAALKKLEAGAEQAFKDVEAAAAKLEPAGALAAWDKYAARVKDAARTEAVAAARQALDARAEQWAKEELAQSADKARKLDYPGALTLVAALEKGLTGFKPLDLAREKEDSLRKQKAVSDKALAALQARLKAGPLELPFAIETRFGNLSWRLTQISGGALQLMAGGAGITKRLAELTGREQYDLLNFGLGADLSKDDQAGLAAFCFERALDTQAQLHLQKSQ